MFEFKYWQSPELSPLSADNPYHENNRAALERFVDMDAHANIEAAEATQAAEAEEAEEAETKMDKSRQGLVLSTDHKLLVDDLSIDRLFELSSHPADIDHGRFPLFCSDHVTLSFPDLNTSELPQMTLPTLSTLSSRTHQSTGGKACSFESFLSLQTAQAMQVAPVEKEFWTETQPEEYPDSDSDTEVISSSSTSTSRSPSPIVSVAPMTASEQVLASFEESSSLVKRKWKDEHQTDRMKRFRHMFEHAKLRPWQSACVDLMKREDSVSLYWIWDSSRHSGKTFLAQWLNVHFGVPSLFFTTPTELLLAAGSSPSSIYVIDLYERPHDFVGFHTALHHLSRGFYLTSNEPCVLHSMGYHPVVFVLFPESPYALPMRYREHEWIIEDMKLVEKKKRF